MFNFSALRLDGTHAVTMLQAVADNFLAQHYFKLFSFNAAADIFQMTSFLDFV